MQKFIIYDDAGRILEVSSVPQEMLALQSGPGRHLMLGKANWDSHFIENEQIAVRPANTATLVDGKLKNLPVPCTIYINGRAYPCEDGEADLAFTYPGTYQMLVEAFPYLDATFALTLP